ncbi:hypothetical protein Tco_1354389 [Tanacetum coccineum]
MSLHPAWIVWLVPYTSSRSDSPDEMSSPSTFPHIPAISPFICTDSSEAPYSSDRPPLQTLCYYHCLLARKRVTARTIIIHRSLLISPVTAPPRFVDDCIEAIINLRSPDHHSSSSSSSSDSSPVHSLGLDASDQAHSGSSTRDYPPTTLESSSGDSPERPMHLSSHSAGPSRKRCRSLVDSAPLSMLVTGSLAPTRADLSPPRTGVDMELGISNGDEVEDHVESDHRDARDDTEEYEADANTGDTAEVGIDPMTTSLVEEEIVEPAGEDSPDSSGTRDGIVRLVEDTPVDLGDAVRDFNHHMSEVRVDRIVGIEIAQGRLEADQLIASGDRARMAEMIYSLRLENLKVRAMLDIERDL